MASARKPWFRFYVEAMHDRKLRRIDVRFRWLWVAVLAAARQSPIPGSLFVAEKDPLTAADMADFAAMLLKDVRAGMAELIRLGMVSVGADGEWIVNNWAERQFESDFSRSSIPDEIKARVFARCNYQCADCDGTEELQIDHIIPLSRAGTDDEENLQILCGPCNRRKGNRLRQQKHRHAVTPPKRDRSRAPSHSQDRKVTSRLCTEAEAEAEADTYPAQAIPVTHDGRRPPTAAAAQLVEQGLAILAERRLVANGSVANPAGYRRAVAAALRDEHNDRISMFAAGIDGPAELTPEAVADWLEPRHRNPEPRPSYEPKPLGCDTCDTGFIHHDDRTVSPCPNCHPLAASR